MFDFEVCGRFVDGRRGVVKELTEAFMKALCVRADVVSVCVRPYSFASGRSRLSYGDLLFGVCPVRGGVILDATRLAAPESGTKVAKEKAESNTVMRLKLSRSVVEGTWCNLLPRGAVDLPDDELAALVDGMFDIHGPFFPQFQWAFRPATHGSFAVFYHTSRPVLRVAHDYGPPVTAAHLAAYVARGRLRTSEELDHVDMFHEVRTNYRSTGISTALASMRWDGMNGIFNEGLDEADTQPPNVHVLVPNSTEPGRRLPEVVPLIDWVQRPNVLLSTNGAKVKSVIGNFNVPENKLQLAFRVLVDGNSASHVVF